jgi:hypothetical protein
MKMSKLYTLGAMLLGGAVLLQNGCLSSFWQGLWTTGFPAHNHVINLGLDILNEELFG